MKKIILIVVVLWIMTNSASAVCLNANVYPGLPAGSHEIAYDNGEWGTVEGIPCLGWALNSEQILRVRFTPPSETIGERLIQARIAWSSYYQGTFFVRINDTIAGSFSDTGTLTNTNGNWQEVDVSALNFVIPNHDFYIEVHHVGGNTKGILKDTSTSSSRSEGFRYDSGAYWIVISEANTDSNNMGIRAVTAQADPGIPEFPTVALPIIAVIGLMFLFQRRKGV